MFSWCHPFFIHMSLHYMFFIIHVCTIKLQWLEHLWLAYPGWFELVSEFLGNFANSSRQQIFRDIFREWDDSNEHTQKYHYFIEYRKDTPKLFLSSDLALWLTFSGSNNPCLITKTRLYNFDPLKPHFYIVKLGFTGVYIVFFFC